MIKGSYKVTGLLLNGHVCKLFIEISQIRDHIVQSFRVLELKITFHLDLLLSAVDVVVIEIFLDILIFILNAFLLMFDPSISHRARAWIVLVLIEIH